MFSLLKEKLDDPTLEQRVRALAREQLMELTDEQRKTLGYTDAMMEGQLQTVLLLPCLRLSITLALRPRRLGTLAAMPISRIRDGIARLTHAS